MKYIGSVSVLLLLLSSCFLIRMDDSINLGDKYRYIQDYPQTIIYYETKSYKGIGVTVVDPIVKAYAFNDRYIIAKSQKEDFFQKGNSLKYPIQYWIIDKKEKLISVQPMDSAIFYKRLYDLGIELTFKEH
jgi:hypothetical protein